MIRILLFFLLFFQSCTGPSQEAIFGKFDFSQGDYCLYVFDNRHLLVNHDSLRANSSRLRSIDSTQYYYSSDPQFLLTLQKNWAFLPVNEEYACGYDFSMFLTRRDSVVLSLEINTRCKELLADGKAYRFDSLDIPNLLPLLSHLIRTENRFESRTDAINQ